MDIIALAVCLFFTWKHVSIIVKAQESMENCRAQSVQPVSEVIAAQQSIFLPKSVVFQEIGNSCKYPATKIAEENVCKCKPICCVHVQQYVFVQCTL